MLRETVDVLRRHRGTVMFLWLFLNITWLAVLFVTDLPASALAIWIAVTIGPMIALRARNDEERSGCRPSEIPAFAGAVLLTSRWRTSDGSSLPVGAR